MRASYLHLPEEMIWKWEAGRTFGWGVGFSNMFFCFCRFWRQCYGLLLESRLCYDIGWSLVGFSPHNDDQAFIGDLLCSYKALVPKDIEWGDPWVVLFAYQWEMQLGKFVLLHLLSSFLWVGKEGRWEYLLYLGWSLGGLNLIDEHVSINFAILFPVETNLDSLRLTERCFFHVAGCLLLCYAFLTGSFPGHSDVLVL